MQTLIAQQLANQDADIQQLPHDLERRSQPKYKETLLNSEL